MAHVRRFDHIGITVADLDTATAFFVGLGLEVEGAGSVEGEFVETVCGASRARSVRSRCCGRPTAGPDWKLASFVKT